MNNLKEERLMVLEMLREEKIDADDAIKLLDSLQSGKGKSYEDFDNENAEDLERKFDKFYASVDTFAKDLKQKLDKAYKETEPKFKKATKVAMEKTAVAIENLSKTLNESAKKMDEQAERSDTKDSECCNSKDEDQDTK
ncbi:MAG: hypothetical protein FWG63_07295 [Defluviitaleaceae bacterium]|nr:hypothetical protein [Defluviitaleaceae bacterium]